MTMPEENLHEGGAVRVKEGVRCPEYERLSLAGWQGRIVSSEEGEDGEPLVGIGWDSATLAAMPAHYIRNSEKEGWDCTEMYLAADEVYAVEPRDSEKEAERAAREIEQRAFWLDMGAQGQRVLEVISKTNPDDQLEAFEAWDKHMREVLEFPFGAKVAEYPERGPLRMGDEIQVLEIVAVDDLRGVLVKAKTGWRKRIIPLCDIEAIPRKSPQRQPISDYCVWFANH